MILLKSISKKPEVFKIRVAIHFRAIEPCPELSTIL
jgi:hypothetical protein